MGRLIWNNKTILEFEKNKLETMISYCRLLGTSSVIDNENIIIYPALYDRIIILKDLSQDHFTASLMDMMEGDLLKEGAVVITGEGCISNSSLQYIDPQLLVAFNLVEDESCLKIYFPSEEAKEHLVVTKHLLRRLSALKLPYKIASKWSKITNSRYWTYLYGKKIPSIIIEIPTSIITDELKELLKNSFVKAIIDAMGKKNNKEEEEKAIELLHNLPSRIKGMLLMEEEELEDIYIKLEDCKKELNDLKKIQSAESIIKKEKIDVTSISQEFEEDIEKDIEEDIEEVDVSLVETIDESESLEEENTVDKDIDDTPSTIEKGIKKDQASKKRKRRRKMKAMYLPASTSKSERNSYNYHVPYPLKIPGDMPVYQFKRPTPQNGRPQLPPNLNPTQSPRPTKPRESTKKHEASTEKIVKDIKELNSVLSQIKTYTGKDRVKDNKDQ
ncbi:hypothetical protein [Alkaliphilus serpentinus]|uniref:Uncharacterized protein n=1 Tax=Alkaliphilus serpentinus TaxID=1482731 RepID=A0A833HMP4_9FIRM|nr:hypothetical protein [Alkaliphilus serpentinus]KAB3527631.1 hypothetical protein F8153_11650 [Alkaliphilus serpentinus]